MCNERFFASLVGERNHVVVVIGTIVQYRFG